jgi:UDP-glucuronate decarboxylase
MHPALHRTLVTGGAGFLGSHLCARLVGSGTGVVCIDDFSTGRAENLAAVADSERFEVVEHDVAEPMLGYFVAGADRIFHLASPASPRDYRADEIGTLRTCVLGTMQVLELARRTGARVLVASTSEVYGDPLVHPQPESYRGNVNPVGPRACYDEGKRAAEAAAASYARQHGVDVRIARIFNTYGPHMRIDDGRVLVSFVAQALRGEPITIYGDGEQTRSLCYVDDMIDGLVTLMESDAGVEPVNLGSDDEMRVLDIAEAVRRATGSQSDIVHEPLPADDPRQRRPDLARARALGWSPRTSLADGLAATIAGVLADLAPGRGINRA